MKRNVSSACPTLCTRIGFIQQEWELSREKQTFLKKICCLVSIKQAVTPRTTISSANLPVRVGTEIMLCSKPQLSASHVLVRSLPIGEFVSTGGAPPTQSTRKQSIGQMRFRPTNAQNGWRGNMVETKSTSSPVRKYEPVINTAQWLLELARWASRYVFLKLKSFEKVEIVCHYEIHTSKGSCFNFLTPAFRQVIDICASCILWRWVTQLNALVG